MSVRHADDQLYKLSTSHGIHLLLRLYEGRQDIPWRNHVTAEMRAGSLANSTEVSCLERLTL